MSRYVPTSVERSHIGYLTDKGYRVIRGGTYDNLLRKVAYVEHEIEFQQRMHDAGERWASNCWDEQRRLADRLTYVYGVARAHGATDEELRQP